MQFGFMSRCGMASTGSFLGPLQVNVLQKKRYYALHLRI